jgi:hypothetical protein
VKRFTSKIKYEVNAGVDEVGLDRLAMPCLTSAPRNIKAGNERKCFVSNT